MMKAPRILDTTLRDGSYVLDFKFTAADTEHLCKALDYLRVPMIEIGHGIGINASSKMAPAAETDVAYVEAGRRGAREAAIAMFCIPGIAGIDDMLQCIHAGLQIVRVGSNVSQCHEMEPFIAAARKHGATAYANFMKSYLAPPAELAKISRTAAEMGAEAVFLVDSAGGLLPKDVTAYIAAMREAVDVPVGFHGHNNLGLAVANCLAAIDAGASIIDTTLSGIGRSSGNPPTEIIIGLLQRIYGACLETDACAMMNLAQHAVGCVVAGSPVEVPITTSLGLAQVHSAFLPKIREAARANAKDVFDTVLRVGDIDRLDLSASVLEQALAVARPAAHEANQLWWPHISERDCLFK